MTEQEQTKWLNVLNEAELGDVITINGLCVTVSEDKRDSHTCEGCAFHTPDAEHYCGLIEGRGVTPCSPFNNCLGKSLVFTKVNSKDARTFVVREMDKDKALSESAGRIYDTSIRYGTLCDVLRVLDGTYPKDYFPEP